MGQDVPIDDRAPASAGRQHPHHTQDTNGSMIPQPRSAINNSAATGQGDHNGAGASCQGRPRTFRRLQGDLGTECCLHTGGSRERPYSATNARIMARVTAWPIAVAQKRRILPSLLPPFGLGGCRRAELRRSTPSAKQAPCFDHTLDPEGNSIQACTPRRAIRGSNWVLVAKLMPGAGCRGMGSESGE